MLDRTPPKIALTCELMLRSSGSDTVLVPEICGHVYCRCAGHQKTTSYNYTTGDNKNTYTHLCP